MGQFNKRCYLPSNTVVVHRYRSKLGTQNSPLLPNASPVLLVAVAVLIMIMIIMIRK